MSNKIQRINIIEAIYNEPKPIDFVIEGFEAGSVGILTGAGSVGKGYFALQLGFALSDTTNTLDFLGMCNEKRGKVGFITAEDSNDILYNRIHNIGQYIGGEKIGFNDSVFNAINENFEVISVRGKSPSIYTRSNDYNTKKAVNEWKNFLLAFAEDKRLLIVDTFRRFFDGDENSSGDVSEALKVFEAIADKTGCAILLTHHTNKSGSIGEKNDEQTSARGSSAIIDNARYQISLAKMSKDQAKEFGISDEERGYYLQVDVPKANYTAPIPKKWLKRQNGGVLDEVDISGKVGINTEAIKDNGAKNTTIAKTPKKSLREIL